MNIETVLAAISAIAAVGSLVLQAVKLERKQREDGRDDEASVKADNENVAPDGGDGSAPADASESQEPGDEFTE